MDERRALLAQLLDDQRERRRIKWVDVARELDMTPQNLTRIRENKISISDKAAKHIERFLLWKPGGLRVFLAGDTPEPLDLPEPEAPTRHHDWAPESIARIRAMTFDQITDIGRQFKATSGEAAAIRWLAEAWQIKAEQVERATLDPTFT